MFDRIVFFDVETGGLDPQRHPIIQFAAIVIDGSWEEIESLELKIKFDPQAADADALRINGYSEEAWRSAVSPAIAMGKICDLFRRHATLEKISAKGSMYTVARVAGHNARFDGEFLAAWFRRAGVFCPAACYEALDTLALARWVSLLSDTKLANHKLGTICAWLGVELAQAHDAIEDVRATVRCARILLSRLRHTNDQ